jgi:hypothetical protein
MEHLLRDTAACQEPGYKYIGFFLLQILAGKTVEVGVLF